MTTTFHIDKGKILKHEFTDEGYLRCFARIARTGDLKYYNSDGTERIECVSEEVLFDESSIDSFKGKAVTDDHPLVPLTRDNTAQYLKGLSSNLAIKERTVDASFLGLALTITDPKLISDVVSGRKDQISCGYWAETKQRSDGKFDQLSRKGNHLAVVSEGRAGHNVRIVMDSAENKPLETWTSEGFNIDTAIDERLTKGLDTLKVDVIKNNYYMKKFTLDAFDFETEDLDLAKHAKAVDSELQKLRSDSLELQNKLSAATKEIETLKADMSQVQGACDVLKTEKTSLESQLTQVNETLNKLQNEKTQNNDSVNVDSEIAARLEQWAIVLPLLKADNADYKPNYSLTVAQIRREALTKKYPSMVLDGKDEGYINGAYEAVFSSGVVETSEVKNDASPVDEILQNIGQNRADSSLTTDAVSIAMQNYLKSFETAYKN